MIALLAEDVHDDPLAQDPEPVLELLGHFQFVVTLVAEIDDLAALDTVEVVVLTQVRVEAPWTALALHNVNEADSGKGQKGSVDGVKRHVREDLLDGLKHRLGRGVFFRLDNFLIYGDPLRRDPEAVLSTCISEEIKGVFFLVFLHLFI